ncbi:PR domain zinc finger protein 5-like [Plodia interpunctella]|uniref:PR domain zinc finger protein 5-like n=1 Tax=Plodia interpunctella TaxID=58824 RepID=UPI0023684E7C|nr:PR domain zinc finger protein 5-like [Plodia interpunctella]
MSETKTGNIAWFVKRKSVLSKHLENIRQILKHSNATPIKNKLGTHFSCCFCDDKFIEPNMLKLHTINNHDTKTKLEFMKGQSLTTFVVKMDITDLICTICNEKYNDLNTLLQHLKAHNVSVHVGATNYIFPFKFNSDELSCAICDKMANNFKMLSEHMNVHYKNFVCGECEAGFVNQRMLRVHGYRHALGEFSCPKCSKVFDTRIKMKAHERAVHVMLNKRNRCGFCGERFTDYTKKNYHEVEMHGVAAKVLKCQACPKTFSNQRSLSVHTRGFHLMEKRKT